MFSCIFKVPLLPNVLLQVSQKETSIFKLVVIAKQIEYQFTIYLFKTNSHNLSMLICYENIVCQSVCLHFKVGQFQAFKIQNIHEGIFKNRHFETA